MRTVFFGTPSWAVPTLEALLKADVDVVAVVTNPDRPAGRGMELRPTPVKETAVTAGLDVIETTSARTDEFHRTVVDLQPEVAVVVAYGKILPGAVLEVPPKGFVNLHFSLLPAYRGAAPVQRAVMEGAQETGVSVMVLTEGMDEGPLLASEATAIGALETAGELGERLAVVGADLLVATLSRYIAGEIVPAAQDHQRATYAPKITPDETRIEWTETAPVIANRVRGLNPDPVAWTTFRGDRVRVLRAAAQPEGEDLAPGELRAERDLVVGAGEGTIRLLELQMPGKRPMDAAVVAHGLRLEPGEGFV